MSERAGEPVVVTSATLREWPLPSPDDGGGKDARGSVVVIGGASDTPGAVLLAGVAALRVGAGKLSIATVETNAPALAVAVPEAGVTALHATDTGHLGKAAVDDACALVEGADAVVIGPGMRDPDDTRTVVAAVLDAIGDDTRVVLDAMALTCGALDDATSSRLSGRVIVTPNVTEAAFVLTGGDRDQASPEPDTETAATLARRLGAVVALRSHVATPDGRSWTDGSGNSGLGTSGSGDVLAGAIGGLAARGADAAQAAVWGAHLHAEAGERLAARVGRLGFLARELLDELPQVLAQLDR